MSKTKQKKSSKFLHLIDSFVNLPDFLENISQKKCNHEIVSKNKKNKNKKRSFDLITSNRQDSDQQTLQNNVIDFKNKKLIFTPNIQCVPNIQYKKNQLTGNLKQTNLSFFSHDNHIKKYSITSTQTSSLQLIQNRLPSSLFSQKELVYSFYQNQNQNKEQIQQKSLTINDFEIINFCGEGSYGSVFKARHLKTNTIYALKKIIKNELMGEVQKQSLLRQVKIHIKLSHPNIVNFYDCFSNQNSIYFVLELCNQGNLYQLLKSKETFQEKQARRIIYQICSGLNYLHQRDIIHRDIKAQNIVLHQNVAKICDFGWATEGEFSRKYLCGTPAYISPEIIQQKLYDKKVDVWSMGILAFQLIYGRIPFNINCQNDLQKIVSDDLYFPEFKQVSEKCKDFIKKCLQKEAEQRWDTENLLNHPFLQRHNSI